jgi:hypothetical protein
MPGKGEPLKGLCPECRMELTLPPGGAAGLLGNYSVINCAPVLEGSRCECRN